MAAGICGPRIRLSVPRPLSASAPDLPRGPFTTLAAAARRMHDVRWASPRRGGSSGIVSGRSGPPSSRVIVSVGHKAADYGTVAAADGSFDFGALWQGGRRRATAATPARRGLQTRPRSGRLEVGPGRREGRRQNRPYLSFRRRSGTAPRGAPARGYSSRREDLRPGSGTRRGGASSIKGDHCGARRGS